MEWSPKQRPSFFLRHTVHVYLTVGTLSTSWSRFHCVICRQLRRRSRCDKRVSCVKRKTVTHCPGQECHDWHYRHVLFYTTGPAGNVHLAGLRCVLFRVQSMENFSSAAYMYHRVSSTQRNSVRPCWHTCFRGRRGRDLRVKFQRKLCIRGFRASDQPSAQAVNAGLLFLNRIESNLCFALPVPVVCLLYFAFFCLRWSFYASASRVFFCSRTHTHTHADACSPPNTRS